VEELHPVARLRLFRNVTLLNLAGSGITTKPKWIAQFPRLNFYCLDNGDWNFIVPNGVHFATG
jgi:hypothetical protein